MQAQQQADLGLTVEEIITLLDLVRLVPSELDDDQGLVVLKMSNFCWRYLNSAENSSPSQVRSVASTQGVAADR